MAYRRRPVYFNSEAESWTAKPASSTELIDAFHKKLPEFQPTKLVRLDKVAEELGVGAVYVKNEGDRLGLPSFKVLGASWGTFKVVTSKLGLALDASIEDVKKAASSTDIKLFAATDGNHGRAVARMGTIFSIPVEIYVPVTLHPEAIEFIRKEGASVVQTPGSYDEAIADAQRASGEQPGGLLIQDSAFDDYEEWAEWIVDGYSTMLREIDTQLGDARVDLVLAPVGVGSLAQAIVSHYKQSSAHARPKVLAVEPDTAACLFNSLRRGESLSQVTTPTIMTGLDCGTLSTIAWPVLKSGVDASVTVSDFEAHRATQDLAGLGVNVGPCGAASLAALRRLSAADKEALGLTSKSVVALVATEGSRAYDIPLDTSLNDAASLTQALVQINSANPQLGNEPGPGETDIARYIAAWFEHRDIETHWIEPVKGRPSVVAVARGTGGGKSIMFNGHTDTVAIAGYQGDPFSGEIKEGHKLYGRGSADMKGGVAAAMLATANAKQLNLSGDVIFAGVADEEDKSIGTEHVLEAGWRADGAIVSEPTSLGLVNQHKGFVWLEVDIHGVSSHGSRADLGIDSITKAGYFLVELDKHAENLKVAGADRPSGGASIHASIIKGGEEASSYPALCTVTIERRTMAGETSESVEAEIRALLENAAKNVADFKYSVRVTFDRPPFFLAPDHPFASLTQEVVGKHLGAVPQFGDQPYWTDCALLHDAGIPALLWGPHGAGFHAIEEWVDTKSVQQIADALTELTERFCK